MTQFPNMPARLITSPHGHLIHYSYAPAGVPGFQFRSTSCGRRVPSTWNLAPRTAAAAAEQVTCPTCQQWARYNLERETLDAALSARLGADWKTEAHHHLPAVDLEAARQLLSRLQELDGTGEAPVPERLQSAPSVELLTSRGRAAARRQEQVRRRGELARAVEALPPRGMVLC